MFSILPALFRSHLHRHLPPERATTLPSGAANGRRCCQRCRRWQHRHWQSVFCPLPPSLAAALLSASFHTASSGVMPALSHCHCFAIIIAALTMQASLLRCHCVALLAAPATQEWLRCHSVVIVLLLSAQRQQCKHRHFAVALPSSSQCWHRKCYTTMLALPAPWQQCCVLIALPLSTWRWQRKRLCVVVVVIRPSLSPLDKDNRGNGGGCHANIRSRKRGDNTTP